MGVGGTNSWGAWPLKPYRVPAADYHVANKYIPYKNIIDRINESHN